MADDVIKSFLVALGFKVDEAGLKKFSQGIVTATKTVAGIAAAAVAAGVAIDHFVKETAAHFENLYYVAQRAGTTVSNLRDLRFAFSQIGLTAADASNLLTQFRMSLLMNPAKEGILHQFGVATREAGGAMRDTKKMSDEFFNSLEKKYPGDRLFWIRAQWAEMMGYSPAILLQREQNRAKEEHWDQEHARKQRILGINADDLARKSVALGNANRDLADTISTLWDKIAGYLMPGMTRFSVWLNKEILEWAPRLEHGLELELVAFKKFVTSIVKEVEDTIRLLTPNVDKIIDEAGKKLEEFHKRWSGPGPGSAGENPRLPLGINPIERDPGNLRQPLQSWGDIIHRFIWGQETQTEEQKKNNIGIMDILRSLHDMLLELQGIHKDSFNGQGGTPDAPGVMNANYVVGGAVGKQASGMVGKFFGWVESKLTLPGGILDRVWAQESRRGLDPASHRTWSGHSALGPFQFIPGTATRFGLDDRNDLAKSAYAAGRYLQWLLGKFHGDVAKALAGYNQGEGAVDKSVSQWGGAWLQHMKPEAQGYVNSILGGGSLGQGGAGRGAPTINQKTDIHVHASNDPARTGHEVAVRQRGVNAEIVRNLRGAAVYA